MKRILLALLLGLPTVGAIPACNSTGETADTAARILFVTAGQIELASTDPLYDAETQEKLAETAATLNLVGHAVRAGATVDDLETAIDAFILVAQQTLPLLDERDGQTARYVLHGMQLVRDILREP